MPKLRLIDSRTRETAVTILNRIKRGWQLIEAGGGWLLGLGGVGAAAVMLDRETDFLVGLVHA